ncbi:ATP-binding protein [Actibacterium sp. 188UL27-1]|uniref:AAA family ATPase n=1 Tax=Actibacterium sp. 188UL27-1 TaxID=2786961 RepID=UPI00195E01E1|nr:ATP-binding protein [Actibacterium sp. 188UL27-1]MBM7068462.1 ATP-binding protein [Actibacterium sp. 188UL27-1]
MAVLHLIEGPVGAGKTTYAMDLGQRLRTPPLVLDAWMVTLFRPDRPETDLWTWYTERKLRCIDQIWSVAVGLLDHGQDAIAELGLVRGTDRAAIFARAAEYGVKLRIHVLYSPQETRRERVAARNTVQGPTFAMVVSPDMFEAASDMWEPLTPAECAGQDVRFIAST